jgi:hypothetical protein
LLPECSFAANQGDTAANQGDTARTCRPTLMSGGACYLYSREMATTETVQREQVLARRIRWFVTATISYNVIAAAVALSEGVRVSSTALIGFGPDSVI